ncbi:MAG: gluconate 2-dehydrogenase subunit 3 family protein [Acidobacteriota bacterium]|nr:gluconate 2-dehydrogenase subunit 3 family protein [Acidobacteriota bacterium]
MSDVSRRDLLRNIALSVTVGGLSAEAAQHVHAVAAAEKTVAGVYKPKLLNAHEYATLQKLGDYIVPADSHSPGSTQAGCADFIDLLASQNPELATIYTGGLFWLDAEMQRRFGATFLAAKPADQKALLDLIAYRKNESAVLGPGIRFFDWARKMVVDAFYTSPLGIKDLGYKGNTAVSKFEIPREALEYALKRSPV